MGGRPQLPWTLGAAIGAFLIVLLMVFVDRPLSGWVAAWPEGRRAVALAITDIGRSHWYLVPSGVGALVLAWMLGREADPLRRAYLKDWIGRCAFLFAAVAVSGVLVQVLKAVFGRARPPLLHGEGVYGFHPFSYYSVEFASFPSGHTATLVAVAMAVGYLAPRWRVALLVAALLLASFRIWVNMHFASDVVAGAMLAIAVTALLRGWFVRRGWLRLPGTPPGGMVPPDTKPGEE